MTFSGSSVTIGDGSIGNAGITFGTVNVTNSNTAMIIGDNGYSGDIAFTGALTLSGTNAALVAMGGSLSLASLNASGTYAQVSFQNTATSITGNLNCGDDIDIAAPTTIGGSITSAGDLTVDEQLTVTGTTNVGGTLAIGASGAGVNTFTSFVTVTGPTLAISGGASHFSSGLTHSTAAVGSSCTLDATITTGASAQVAINADAVAFGGSLAFYSLFVTNPTGTFTSTADFSISSTASFAKDLSMSGHTLTFLPSSPLTSMIGNAEVIGTVRRTLQASGLYTFTGASSTLLVPGLAAAEEYEFLFMKAAPDQQAITRYYDIRRVSQDLTPAAGTYTLGLQYKDPELNGNDENTLLLCYGAYGVAGENQFSKLVTSNVNSSANIVTYAYDGAMSLNQRYTLADLNAPLPVELVAFSARRKSDGVDLRWTTATELSNFGFDIERATSREGEFVSIGFAAGQGSKLSPTDYRFTDTRAPATTLFYRLKQIDRDGDINYGPIVEVSKSTTTTELGNYPNPFNPTTTITFSAPADGAATLTIVNTLGETVASPFSADVMLGERVSVPFNASDLPGGTYFYRLRVGETVSTGKMQLLK